MKLDIRHCDITHKHRIGLAVEENPPYSRTVGVRLFPRTSVYDGDTATDPSLSCSKRSAKAKSLSNSSPQLSKTAYTSRIRRQMRARTRERTEDDVSRHRPSGPAKDETLSRHRAMVHDGMRVVMVRRGIALLTFTRYRYASIAKRVRVLATRASTRNLSSRATTFALSSASTFDVTASPSP